MRARIVKRGLLYVPQVYDEVTERWYGYDILTKQWIDVYHPKTFFTKKGAEDLLNSFKEFEV